MLDQPMTSKMIAEKDGAIGHLIFNNPARHNAVSLDMWEGVARIIDDFERDDAIRVIVVSGAGGRAFVSGADISEFKERRASEEAAAAYAKISEGARLRLQETLKPTIAMIRGYCIGGGVGTALACDMRVAAEGSKFGVPAAKLGLGYAYDGIKKLVDLVGPAYAREIFYTARQFTAEEALRMGLVNQVVPEGELEGYVKNYCALIAANAPLTVRAAKVAIREALKDESARDLDLCKRLVDECFASADYAEGRTAFMEKRRPHLPGGEGPHPPPPGLRSGGQHPLPQCGRGNPSGLVRSGAAQAAGHLGLPLIERHEARGLAAMLLGLGHDRLVRQGQVDRHAVRLRHVPGRVHVDFDLVALGIGEIAAERVAVAGLPDGVDAGLAGAAVERLQRIEIGNLERQLVDRADAVGRAARNDDELVMMPGRGGHKGKLAAAARNAAVGDDQADDVGVKVDHLRHVAGIDAAMRKLRVN